MKIRFAVRWFIAPLSLCALVATLLADQVIVVPGTIAGTVTVGSLPITQLQISAAPSGGSSSSIVLSPNTPTPPYSMTVGVAQTGTTTFSVSAFVRTDQNRDFNSFSSVTTPVSATTPGQVDFTLASPGFVDPSFTVTGGATISSVSLNANFFSGSISEQSGTNAPGTANFIFPAFPRTGISLSGSVQLSNGLQVQLPQRTINVVANQTTSVAYTVDGSATGSVGGTISFTGALNPDRVDVSVSGPTSKSIVQQPPTVGGTYAVGPLSPGTGYFVSASARFNNFDDVFSFPNAAYSPSRSNLTVGTGQTSVDVSAQQSYINGDIQLTGAAGLLPFVSSGFVFVSGTNTATSGGSSQDQISPATKTYDLVVSPGAWRFSQTTVNFFRPAPTLSGSFSFFDNRPTATTTVLAGETAAVNIPIALGEVTLTMTVAGGGTLSNPSVFGNCIQRDDSNIVVWQTSFSFSTSGQNNVQQGTVTFVTPSGQCTITPRAVINGQTVTLPTSTVQVIAGSSQTVDVGGPTLTITSPVPEAIVGSNSVSVSGKASDDIAVASVTVNGIATSLSSAGNPNDPPQVNFLTVSPVPLQRGPNTITTVAKDTATPQNTTTDTRTVYWDTGLPTLSFTPASGFNTFASSVSVTGTADDDAGVKKITINGTDTTFSSTNPSLPNQVSFTGSVSLSPGANSIVVVVTDISNRTTTQTHTVTRQQQAPTTLSLNAATATFGGTVSLSAILTSQSSGVAGKTVHFTVNGNSADGVTDANGMVTATGLSVSGLNVGSYPSGITASFAGDTNFGSSNGTAQLTITKAGATLTLGNLSQNYDGSIRAASVATSPAGLSVVSLTYNGSPTAPSNAGSYTVVASLTNANYDAPNVTGTLVINKASATLGLGNLTHTYDGSPKSAATTTTPSGLSGVSLTYNGSTTAPTNAGSYTVVASLTNTNYDAPSATATLVISKANATLSLSNLTHVYDASPKVPTVATTPGGLAGVSLTYDGSPAAPTNAGSYAVVASLTNTNYEADSATGTLVISKATATLSLSNLTHTYDGSSKAATVTTSPASLSGVAISYSGSSTAPSDAGNYAVVASLTNANYTAPDATGTLSIGKANQTISFAMLSNRTFGDADFAVTASSSSGAGVSLTAYSGSCTVVNGNSVHLTGAGSCTIRASQTGNTNYNAAPDVDRSFTIGKANQSISITTGVPASATYNTTFNTAATGVGSNNPVIITASGACSVTAGGSGGAAITMTSGSGTCTVFYNQAGDANYNAAPALSGATAAQKAAQTIVVTTSAPAAALFGTSFTVAATGGGSANPVSYTSPAGDGCSDVGPTFSVLSGTTACQIVYKQVGNANYNDAMPVTQSVNVVGYTFTGFLQPIDMPVGTTTVWNTATAGQAIPAKWQLTLDGNLVSSLSSYVGMYSAEVACGTGAGSFEDAIEEYAPGASTITYDGNGNFHINWKTLTSYKGKCRAFYVTFNDGTISKVAYLKFK